MAGLELVSYVTTVAISECSYGFLMQRHSKLVFVLECLITLHVVTECVSVR